MVPDCSQAKVSQAAKRPLYGLHKPASYMTSRVQYLCDERHPSDVMIPHTVPTCKLLP
jgi:hypothetical protein